MRAVLTFLAFASAEMPAPVDPARPIRDLAAALQALPPPLTLESVEAPIAAAFDLGAIALEALDGLAATASPEQIARLARVYGRRIAREAIETESSPTPDWTVAETRAIETGGWLVTTSGRLSTDAERFFSFWSVD